jgi:hypothetical protein
MYLWIILAIFFVFVVYYSFKFDDVIFPLIILLPLFIFLWISFIVNEYIQEVSQKRFEVIPIEGKYIFDDNVVFIRNDREVLKIYPNKVKTSDEDKPYIIHEVITGTSSWSIIPTVSDEKILYIPTFNSLKNKGPENDSK